jgi:hypothetical protein
MTNKEVLLVLRHQKQTSHIYRNLQLNKSIMNILTIELKDNKAYKLIEDMEALNLIRILKKKPIDIPSLRNKIKSRMTEEQIDSQLDSIRKEWQRNI